MAVEDILFKIAATYNGSGVQEANADINRLRTNSKLLTESHSMMGRAIIDSQKDQARYWDGYFANSKKATKLTGDLNAVVKKAQRPFAGYAMSIMFAGMALQRIFTGIAKSGIKTFQDISHSVEGTVTASDRLDSSFKFLGYTIGAALEPLLDFLVPIVTAVAEWVEENPKLTAGIIAFGAALGTLMMAGGSLKLAIDGISTFKNILKNTDWQSLGRSIQKGIGVIAIGYSLFMTKDAIDAFIKGDSMKGLLKALGATATMSGGIMLLKGKGIGGALVVAGFALDYASENQDTFLKDLISLVGSAGSIVMTLTEMIVHMFKNAWNNIKASFEVMWLEILKGIAKTPILGDLLGLNVNDINKKITDAVSRGKLGPLEGFDFVEVYTKYQTDNKRLAEDIQRSFNRAQLNAQVESDVGRNPRDVLNAIDNPETIAGGRLYNYGTINVQSDSDDVVKDVLRVAGG